MNIVVIDLKGERHEIPARKNWSIMEIIRDSPQLFVRAECGGSCACATCHVYVDPAWIDKLDPATEDEIATLDGGFNIEPNSRLSCQISFEDALDGLTVTLTQDSSG